MIGNSDEPGDGEIVVVEDVDSHLVEYSENRGWEEEDVERCQVGLRLMEKL